MSLHQNLSAGKPFKSVGIKELPTGIGVAIVQQQGSI
jgi:hypothetical protein